MIVIKETDDVPFVEQSTNTIYIPRNINQHDYISRITTKIHTDTHLWFLWETVRMSGKSTYSNGRWLDYIINENGIIEQRMQEVGFALDWWANKISCPADFDKHPHNISIHEYLPTREPLYQSENIWITKSGSIHINVPGWGWVSEELLLRENISSHLKEELDMALNIISIT